MGDRYRIITTGEISSGTTKKEVEENLAQLCKYDQTKLEKVFSGTKFIFKSNIDLDVARRYKNALDKTGIVCHIEPLPILPSASNETWPAPAQTTIASQERKNLGRERGDSPEITNPSSKRVYVLLAILVILAVSGWVFYSLPKHYQYEVTDSFKRFTAPNFTHALDQFGDENQADVIREFKSRGYEFNCYGGLRHEELVIKGDDYVCFFKQKTAYDNIPARFLTFSFKEKKLHAVRLEFPDTSLPLVKDYLGKTLNKMKRLDTLPGCDFGTDNFGYRLLVWGNENSHVATSAGTPDGQPFIVLWANVSPCDQNQNSPFKTGGEF